MVHQVFSLGDNFKVSKKQKLYNTVCLNAFSYVGEIGFKLAIRTTISNIFTYITIHCILRVGPHIQWLQKKNYGRIM
jgi:hypothetical protein